MAWDEGLAQLMRDDLAGRPVVEKKMFGGLAFLIGGHMVCGVHRGGAMFRVGKAGQAAALALPGVALMEWGERTMTGMVDVSDMAMATDATRQAVMALALAAVEGLPPKLAKARKTG